MEQDQNTIQSPPPGWRFTAGVVLFVLAWVLPIFIPLVALSGLSTTWKAAFSGLLIVGGPELLGSVSILLVSRSGFRYLTAKARERLRV